MPYNRNELQRLLAQNKERMAAMSLEDKKQMLEQQRQSWVRAEMEWPKPKYQWVNGVKVYDSYEDYLND